ncbi:MAG: methyltransferase domain-containing protein [Candidatus Heimdallarchaeota archaeon]|nr:MAG: methyltransferase domain-containing protein [Candidatus Heimdallarchaeota archaeon]
MSVNVWSGEPIPNEQSTLGVGVPLKDAEMVRHRLIKSKLLLQQKKPIKTKELVFFPITDPKQIPSLLSDITFEFQQKLFSSRLEQEPIKLCLQKEFPHIKWEDISLKYDQIGEIAVLKLNSSITSQSIRQRVGELILSRSPRLKAVINKSDIVVGVKRVYPIEHLAGKRIWQSWHQEYGVFIFIDLRAYFNPRLAEEHHRVAMSVNPGERILDLFTGVGSFALHCAKKTSCDVVAIDINSYAINALKRSIKKNKLKGNINPIIGDSLNILRLQSHFDRVIINLPQVSVNYLPYGAKLLKKGGIITFYQFISKSETPETQIRHKVSKELGDVISYKEQYIKVGREVSPSRIQVNIDLQIN